MSCPSRSSTECRHRSSVELSSSLSSTEDRYQHLVKNVDEEELGFSRSFGNVMLASGYVKVSRFVFKFKILDFFGLLE